MKHLLLTTIAAVLLKRSGNPQAGRALRIASCQGNITAVKKQLDAGMDMNAKNDEWRTLLPSLSS